MMPRHRVSPSFGLFLLCCSWGLPIGHVKSQTSCADFAPPLIIQGKRIYNTVTKDYIPIKGVNYYPRPNTGSLIQTNSIDFIAEEFRPVWERDVQYFQQLNVNVVRLYAVEPGRNHDGFMCALKSAGIYAIVGLSADCENCAITKDSAPLCYPEQLKQRGQFIISEFARYDNVLGFDAGNEVNLLSGFVNAACQKQFIRDMRAFVQSCSDTIRSIPIGLAIADIERLSLADDGSSLSNVYVCHDVPGKIICRSDVNDELENAEFIGLNTYLHCDGGLADGEPLVGYEMLLSDFELYKAQVPVMLTEFGCVDPSFENGQRDFRQVDLLFSERFRKEFVGGVVFEYSTESINSQAPYPFSEYGEGNFGLGYLTPEFCDDINITCQFSPFPQFSVLASKYGAVDTAAEPSLSDDEIEQQIPICPTQFSSLQSYAWSTRATPDRECPGRVYVACSGVPDECVGLGVPFQPVAPLSTAPQTDQANIMTSPTKSPAFIQGPLSTSALPTTGLGLTLPFSQSAAPLRQETLDPTLAPSLRDNETPTTASPSTRPANGIGQPPSRSTKTESPFQPTVNPDGESTSGVLKPIHMVALFLSCFYLCTRSFL